MTHSFARHKWDSQQASDSCVEVPGNFVTVSDGLGAMPIRISEDVLAAIRRISVEQFLSIPRGGLEAGGLLFGRAGDDGLTIAGHEALPIEHLSGPAFLLSPQDEDMLAARLRHLAAEDGPEVVGWWHSHTRSDVAITDEDLRVHRQFFTEDKQVALIVKPFKLAPADAAIYLPNGAADPKSPCCRFTIENPPPARVAPLPVETVRAEPLQEEAVAVPSPVVFIPPVRRSGARRRAYTLAALIAITAAGFVAVVRSALPNSQPVPVEPMRLQLSGSGPELTMHWSRAGQGLADIATAELVIVDGGKATKIPLTADNLMAGSLAYVRQTGKVDVTLRTRTRANEMYEAVAHYLGPEPVRPIVAEAKPKASDEVERMKAEMERLNSELERMRAIPSKPPEVNAKSRTPEHRPATLAPIAMAPKPAQPAPSVPALPVPAIPVGAQVLAGQTPSIETPAIQAPPPAQPKPPSAQPKAIAAQPTSGRAIWTGTLSRGGVLLFDGRRPSAGSLTGRMPHRPSRIRVYPADLTESGIVIYTSAAKERIEIPSAANGWNVTAYRPDPKRSRDITLIESPGPGNGWQRLILRSEQRTVSMLVLDWDEIPGQ